MHLLDHPVNGRYQMESRANSKTKIRHVALLVETHTSCPRSILRGVRRYITEARSWSVFLDNGSRIPSWLSSWQGDGIISRSYNQEVVDMVKATGVPAVELRAYRANQDIPYVGVDNHLLGKMVAEHFLERGFRHFGCYALDTESFEEERLDAFIERRNSFVATIAQHGFPCKCYEQSDFGDQLPKWRSRQKELIDWAVRLRKPCGIMANTDRFGFWLLDACSMAMPT